MKNRPAFILAAALGAVAFAQPTVQAPKPPPELGQLAIYLGEWRLEGVDKASPLGPAGWVRGQATGAMILQGFFLEWRWQEETPAGKSQGIEYLGYSPVTKAFPNSLFSDSGTTVQGEYAIAGNTSAFTGKILAAGKQYHLRATEIFAADGRSFQRTADVSSDGRTWIPCFEGKFTKVTTP